MTAENWIVAIMAGFVVGWIANAVSKSRYSFPINLFVGVFGATLLNFYFITISIAGDSFFSILLVSVAGSSGLLGLYHLTRSFERR